MGDGEENHKIRMALELARYELVTLNGLVVADGAAPNETLAIDTAPIIKRLDAVISEFFDTDKPFCLECIS